MGMISKIYGSSRYMREVYAERPPEHLPPIMSWIGNRYEVERSYAIKDKLKRLGFRWDPAGKVWWTTNPKIAKRALRFVEASIDLRKRTDL